MSNNLESEPTLEPRLKDLDPRIQKQIDNANKAIASGNAPYAIDLCNGLLERNPGCLDIRKVLRQAQFAAKGANKGGAWKKLTTAPFMPGAKKIVQEPEKALNSAETYLTKDPYNVAAHRMLALAANTLKYHSTAVFAYEEVRKLEPKNLENLASLARAYFDAGSAIEDLEEKIRLLQLAVKTGDTIMQDDPGNGAAGEVIKNASVAITVAKGKYEEGSYQDSLADKDQAVKLEQASRAVNDEEALEGLIKACMKQIEKEPGDVNAHREISEYYEQMGDFDRSIEWVQKARALPKGKADNTLEYREGLLGIARLEAQISGKKEDLEKNPDNTELKSEIEKLEKDLYEFRFNQAKSLVEKYPNNYAYHFDYGELLFAEGRVDEAAKSFQQAQRNPNVRLKALLYLAKAFKHGNKFDMAADQLNVAKKESPIMDNFKKEVIYELAGCYESLNRMEDAINEYKVIYTADIGYRDVSEKIDQFYADKS